MIRLAVSVEGRTEEEFVKNLLAPYLQSRDIHLYPVILGGNVQIQRLADNIANLFWSHDAVTSFVDFYGFRYKDERTPDELQNTILSSVQNKIKSEFDASKVFPYVQKHEFEALLFSNVSAFARLPGVADTTVSDLRAVRAGFSGPEDINDSSTTAPSKRIGTAIPRYRKVADGAIVAAGIGLPAMRRECPRFDAWVARMEALKPA